MKVFKRVLTVTLILSLAIGANVSMAYASDSQKTVQPSDVDGIKLAIDSVKDPIIKEKLLDLNNIEYLELVVDDNTTSLNDEKATITDSEAVTESEINLTEEKAINTIEELSKLNENQLDAVIENKIQDLIDMQEERTDIVILPSSYEVLEKYNFGEEVAELQNVKQKAVVSSEGSAATSNDYTGWEKAYTGKIRNGAGSTVATYTLTVQWFKNSSNKIYYWDLYHGGSSDQNYYKFMSYNVNQEDLVDSSKALCVQSQAKYKKTLAVPEIVPPYNLILIYVECTNTGGFSASSWTEATY